MSWIGLEGDVVVPGVTVLMTVYNGMAYLAEAIESILVQSYDDFEFLIIDDASTDGSVALIRSYADERIRLVRNPVNLGQVSSLNKGLWLARGKYVARLDQDDSSYPTRLERQVAVLEANARVAVVGTWMQAVDGNGRHVRIWPGRLNDQVAFLSSSLTNRLQLYHPSVMYRRDVVLRLGGYDEELPYSEDQDLWRRMALAGYEARIIPVLLCRYRVHEGQQTMTKSEIQQRNSELGRERFIEALSSRLFSREIRMFFEGSPCFWYEVSTPAAAREFTLALGHMLANVQSRLLLSPSQFHKLERTFCCRAARTASSAWRRGVMFQLRVAGPLYLFSLRGGLLMVGCRHVWTYPVNVLSAPILLLLRRPKHRLSALVSGHRRCQRLFEFPTQVKLSLRLSLSELVRRAQLTLSDLWQKDSL